MVLYKWAILLAIAAGKLVYKVARRFGGSPNTDPVALRARNRLALVETAGVRFAAWDSAGNGAFWQPIHLKKQ